MLGEKRLVRKVADAVIQGFRKGFDKGTAAAGACLVELHAVDRVILDLDAFHILSADIQDAVYFRVKESGGVVMRYRLHLALVQHQSRLDQRLAVAGGAGIGDPRIGGKMLIDFLYRLDGGL